MEIGVFMKNKKNTVNLERWHRLLMYIYVSKKDTLKDIYKNLIGGEKVGSKVIKAVGNKL